MSEDEAVFIDASAVVEEGVEIGPGTKIWRFSHVMAGARIGQGCVLSQGTFVGGKVRIGNGCRIQNNVSLYDGVELEDQVFVGPSAVFTNVSRPRAAHPKKPAFLRTLVRKGATIGANATVLPGITIGEHAFVAAGAIVTKSVPSHALVEGAPARIRGWICACGECVVREERRPLNVVCWGCGMGPGE